MKYLKFVPKNMLSRMVGESAKWESPEWLAKGVRDWFVKQYKINMGEAELPLDSYKSVSELFIRKLKPGVRPIGEGIVHPCDADLTVVQKISDKNLVQAKGRTYPLNGLLGHDGAEGLYRGGFHLVYYLCPTDYHRVHSPVDGQVESVVHFPGHLWPVNKWSVENVDDLFAVNERIVFNIRTPKGVVALVMVGATNVGEISVSFDPSIRSNQPKQSGKPTFKKFEPSVKVSRGDELGIFHMGSTVVMVYPPGMIEVEPKLGPVKMGASLSK